MHSLLSGLETRRLKTESGHRKCENENDSWTMFVCLYVVCALSSMPYTISFFRVVIRVNHTHFPPLVAVSSYYSYRTRTRGDVCPKRRRQATATQPFELEQFNWTEPREVKKHKRH